VSFEQQYSTMDRWVHRLAFSSQGLKLTAADIETTMFAKRFKHVQVTKPVFITSLPRAGTTLLLDLVQKSPKFATHCYRDMPFIYAPMLWRSLSGGFQKPMQLTERAHGDGMQVGFDSPEAFEEVLWHMFWPEKFRKDGIELWQRDEDVRDFDTFFVDHMRKIIALKGPDPTGVRYISKNNANIGRIPFLRRLLPDAIIMVPFREPVDQAVSLHQQHMRFLKVHATEPFSRRYMEDIGHLEFGELHRPLLFPQVASALAKYSPESLDYWIAYWIAAFEYALQYKDEVRFISYERSCQDPGDTLAALRRELQMTADDRFEVAANLFHAPRSYRAQVPTPDAALAQRASDLYQACLALSVL
jgi:Sulfotransferase family